MYTYVYLVLLHTANDMDCSWTRAPTFASSYISTVRFDINQGSSYMPCYEGHVQWYSQRYILALLYYTYLLSYTSVSKKKQSHRTRH